MAPVVQKQYQAAIRTYLVNTIIPNIENSGTHLLPGIPVGITGSLISPGTVGNYASMLHQQLTPKAKDLTNDAYKKSTSPPKRNYVPIANPNKTYAEAINKKITIRTPIQKAMGHAQCPPYPAPIQRQTM